MQANQLPSQLPVSSPVPLIQPLTSANSEEPEWLRISSAVRRFGIGRSTLYLLMKANAFKHCCIRRRGNILGIRLIEAASLRDYLASLALEQTTNTSR
jgi:hypothetical protein